MVRVLGARGASAVMGLLMLALGSSEASAQNAAALNTPAVIRTLDVNAAAKPLGSAVATTAVSTASGAILQAQPATSVTVQLVPTIASEATWLYKAGWPLYALVDRYGAASAPLNDEANCIATAVYFEARGESVEGQLAVARVVMNRAASGQYPASWCGVVKQPAQFSFVRHGLFPAADTNSDAWKKAIGVTRLAIANVVPSLPNDVLWYHANYVAPSWGRRLNMFEQIGAHIFYRA